MLTRSALLQVHVGDGDKLGSPPSLTLSLFYTKTSAKPLAWSVVSSSFDCMMVPFSPFICVEGGLSQCNEGRC